MKTKLRLPRILFYSVLAFPSVVFAQNPLKWGKISEKEAKMTVCSFDSAASAVVLSDYGKITIDYGVITIERHKRIKILDNKALDEADISLPYYVKDRLERIEKLEAQTISMDKTGKPVVTEVANNQMFDVEISKDWREKRFGFPKVEAGSIIEYRYRTISQNYTFLEGWLFQSDIPTLHSEMSVQIMVGDLDYRVLLQGDRLMQKYQKQGDQAVSKWMLENIPALVKEPFVANHFDYAEKVGFQLMGYKKSSAANGVEYKTVMTTWEKLAEELLLADNYANYLNRHGAAKDVISQLLKPADDESAKIRKIYNHIKDNFTWNGKHRVFAGQPFNDFMKTKHGSSAEINLFLTLLLQEAGLPANPALISTRPNGKIQKSYPMVAQFNHILANVKTDGKDLLLDATDPLRPYNLLAPEDLNWSAFLLDKKASRWLPIEQTQVSKETVYAEINLENPGKPMYSFSVRYEGYGASEARRKFRQLGEEKFIAQQKIIFGDKKLVKFEQENLDKIDEYLLQKYQLEPEEPADNQAATLYFQPVVWHQFHENPFKGTRRNLPIELDYPRNFQFVLSLRIPANYRVQEMPAPLLLSLPGNMGNFRYQITANGSQLQLVTNVQMKNVFIPADYFPHLQAFNDRIIAKYQEMVVLKKAP